MVYSFDFYQNMARETKVPATHKDKIIYPALALVGEAGEVANEVKKMIWDDDKALTSERRMKIMDELGDVLWYISALADDLETTIGQIATLNLDKLADRKASLETITPEDGKS